MDCFLNCPNFEHEEEEGSKGKLTNGLNVVVSPQDGQCKECHQFQSKMELLNLVRLAPATMQLCGIQIGAHVLVESPNAAYVFKAWPCLHLHPPSVSIHSSGTFLLH